MIKKKNIYKYVFKLLNFLFFLIVAYFLFNKFNKYIDQNNFAKIIILIFLNTIFFLGIFLKNFYKSSLVFFFYSCIILYSVNILLVINDLKNLPENKIAEKLNKIGKAYDERSLIEVVNDERLKGEKIYPYVVPREFLSKNITNPFILSPMPNTKYVSCNENGFWKIIKTDNYGFNNKKNLIDFDILILGDSFAEGSCVDQNHEPASIFKNKYNINAYNIGISGNGPLLSLALAHEVKDIFKFKKIVWFIYDNDFYDLKLEKQYNYLNNYLDLKFIKNNYFNNLTKLTASQEDYIFKNFKSFKKKYSIKENILELKSINNRVNSIILNMKNGKKTYFNEKILLNKIFKKINYLYKENEIFIVYLPESSCFEWREIDCIKRSLAIESQINEGKFINFFSFVKNNIKDYKKLYALEQHNVHFSNLGYELLIDLVFFKINLN